MSHTDHQKLQGCFDSLWMIIADKQAGIFETVSFKHGEIYAQEGYKYDILKQAELILKTFNWEEPNIIGSGKIGKMAGELLAIRPHQNEQQNLVDYRDVLFFFDQIDSKYQEKIEKALYLLYVENSDQEAFNLLVQALKKRYALISYFFFLKDCTKYQVVRPKNLVKRFSLIGAPAQCVLNCNWKNYQIYLSILREIQKFLQACLIEEITLTDTHSFVWMFWMLENHKITAINDDVQIRENHSTVIVSAKEGRKILYYSTKYERNPHLRAEAIRLHGCSCAACGFSFESVYGQLGMDFIEVHHIKPLHTLDGEVEVSPLTDMVCLCANCHRMIHRKRNAVLSVTDLQKCLEEAKSSN